VSLKTLVPFLTLYCLSFWSSLYAFAAGPSADEFLGFTHDDGFCLRGLFTQIRWDPAADNDGGPVWGSFCDNNASVGRILSDPFLAPSRLSFSLAGYAGSPGLRLYLRNLESLEEFDLHPQTPAGDSWHSYSFELPDQWLGKPVQMIGEDNAKRVQGWFAFSAPRLPDSSLARGYLLNRPQAGFCDGPDFPLATWGDLRHPAGLVIWRSSCDSGDKDTGYIASKPFTARTYVALYLAGYPGTFGVRLALENLRTGQQLPLLLERLPRELWHLYYFPVPRDWIKQPVRVVAEDNATGRFGWVAFAIPPQGNVDRWFGVRLLLLCLGLSLLTMLPAVAACSVAARRGATNLVDLTSIGLLALGFVGYFGFWIYFLSRRAGEVYSWGTLLTSIVILIRAAASRSTHFDHSLLWRIARPWLLVATASLFIVNLGFIYGKYGPLQEYSAGRFGPPFLSVDNWLPKILADDVYQNHIPKPMFGDWLSSDRPPLQAGSVLWHYAWLHGNREIAYQILGTTLQLTFLAALWAYLDAAGVNRRAMALVMAATLFAGFTIENSFFVWPKLLPVGFLLIIIAYLFTPRYESARKDRRTAIMVGSSAALAMLCHGGSVFGLIGIALTLLLLGRLPGLRFIAIAALTAIVVYLPWSLYQKYYDPPGDRLLKMHLAATPEPRPEISFGHLVVQKYKEARWIGTLRNKRVAFSTLFDDRSFQKRMHDAAQYLFFGNPQQRAVEVASLRDTMFLRWFWSIDLLSFVIFAWMVCAVLRKPRNAEFRQGSVLWICTALTLLNWCLLMFAGGTIVHQGCYFTEIAAFAAGVLTLWAISARLAAIFVACHVALTFALYVFLAPPSPPGMATMFAHVNDLIAWSSAFGAVAFVALLWSARNEQPETPLHAESPTRATLARMGHPA
jgi:hypothetical protein